MHVCERCTENKLVFLLHVRKVPPERAVNQDQWDYGAKQEEGDLEGDKCDVITYAKVIKENKFFLRDNPGGRESKDIRATQGRRFVRDMMQQRRK